MKSVTGFVGEPEPAVVFHTFGGSSVELTAYFWIDTKLTNPPAAKDAALTRVKTVFEESNVEIPYPVQAVLLQSEK